MASGIPYLLSRTRSILFPSACKPSLVLSPSAYIVCGGCCAWCFSFSPFPVWRPFRAPHLSVHFQAALFGFHTAKFHLSPLGFRHTVDPLHRWAVCESLAIFEVLTLPLVLAVWSFSYSWIPFNNKGTPPFTKRVNTAEVYPPVSHSHTHRVHAHAQAY